MVTERFGASLDLPDRPATWDPQRASRDPQTWAALCTYGHPQLASLLDRRAGPHLPDGSALVLGGVHSDGPVTAVRSDRTPPTLIHRLSEVDGLGAPTSRGEAESLADRLAQEAASVWTARELASIAADTGGRSLADRFVALAREAIAGVTAQHEEVDSAAAWRRLTADPTSPWGYADGLRQRLDVSHADLLSGSDAIGSAVDEPWDVVRRRLDSSLALLTAEYQQSRK